MKSFSIYLVAFILPIATFSQLSLNGGYLLSCGNLEDEMLKFECSNVVLLESIMEDSEGINTIEKHGVFSVQYKVNSNGELNVHSVIPVPQRIYDKSIEAHLQDLLLKHMKKFEWKYPQRDVEFGTAVGGIIRIDTDKF